MGHRIGVRAIFYLLGLSICLTTSGCPDPNSDLPPAQPGTSAIIGTAGGTLEVSDPTNLIYGTKLVFPPSALAQDASVTVSASTQAPLLPKGLRMAGPLVELAPSGLMAQHGSHFEVTIPYSTSEPVGSFGVYDTASGVWDVGRIVAFDAAAKTVTAWIPHFSCCAWIVADASDTSSVNTDFKWISDTFPVENSDTLAYCTSVHGGHCAGLSSFALWYRRSIGSGLRSRFDMKTACTIACSAQNPAILDLQTIIGWLRQSGLNTGESLITSMQLTGRAQRLWMDNGLLSSGHEVVVYAWDDPCFYVYDVNHLDYFRLITYDRKAHTWSANDDLGTYTMHYHVPEAGPYAFEMIYNAFLNAPQELNAFASGWPRSGEYGTTFILLGWASGGTPPYAYRWSAPAWDGSTDQSVNVTPPTTTAFVLTVTDSAVPANTATAGVYIGITHKPGTPPQLNDVTVIGSLTAGQPCTVTVTCLVSDSGGPLGSDATVADLSAIGGPQAQPLTNSADQQWSWIGVVTPPAEGTRTIIVTVHDGKGGTDTESKSVSVGPPNAPPSVDGPLAMGALTQDQPATISVQCTASDMDGTVASVTADLSEVGGPSLQALAKGVDQWTWSGTVTPRSAGTKIITFVATDNKGATGANTASIDVDAPAGWQQLGGDLTGGNGYSRVCALSVWNGQLVAAGEFTMVDGVACNSIAAWDGTAWHALGGGVTGGGGNVASPPSVEALTNWSGQLVAGGGLSSAGGVNCSHVASWDGASWHPLGGGLNNAVSALLPWNGQLIAAGYFYIPAGIWSIGVAAWNGSSWSPLDSWGGLNDARDQMESLVTWNSQLVLGGSFQSAGGIPCNYIVAWDGAMWHPLGNGTNNWVPALTVWNGQLVAGGLFTTAGGTTCNHIAAWDGTSWRPLATGTNGTVRALTTWNGHLVAGGSFNMAGGVTCNSVATWDGTSWRSLDSDAAGNWTRVYALAAWNGRLIVAGDFESAGGATCARVAAWGQSQ